jgi:hypothetical protein
MTAAAVIAAAVAARIATAAGFATAALFAATALFATAAIAAASFAARIAAAVHPAKQMAVVFAAAAVAARSGTARLFTTARRLTTAAAMMERLGIGSVQHQEGAGQHSRRQHNLTFHFKDSWTNEGGSARKKFANRVGVHNRPPSHSAFIWRWSMGTRQTPVA